MYRAAIVQKYYVTLYCIVADSKYIGIVLNKSESCTIQQCGGILALRNRWNEYLRNYKELAEICDKVEDLERNVQGIAGTHTFCSI